MHLRWRTSLAISYRDKLLPTLERRLELADLMRLPCGGRSVRFASGRATATAHLAPRARDAQHDLGR
jgi:hypothetical protein